MHLQNELDLNKLATINIFLENAILHTEEVYLLSHVKLCKNNLDKCVNIPDLSEMSCFAECLYRLICNGIWTLKPLYHISAEAELGIVAAVYEELMNNLCETSKFPVIIDSFKREYLNANVLDNVYKLVKLGQSGDEISKQCNQQIILLFVDFLLNCDCDKQMLLNQIYSDCYTSETFINVELQKNVMSKMLLKFVSNI